MKKRKIAITILTFIFIISSCMTFAYASNIITTKGNFKTKGVDVSLDTIAGEEDISPGMKVKYEPEITYKGVDSYIRVSLNISEEYITADNFEGLDNSWVRKGNYFYYKKPVENGSKIETFKTFSIPREWDETTPEDIMGSTFNIEILCDAIQADNFTPNFESDFPWGENIEIEDSSYDGTNYVKKDNKLKPIDLTMHGDSKYSLSSSSLVDEDILPGDIIKNEIRLINTGKHLTEVFFYVSEMENIEKNNLLDALTLKLSLDGKEFFNGSLRAKELTKIMSLVNISAGDTHILSYEIHMPKELQNAYQDKMDTFIWNFTATEHPIVPKTGDNTILILYIAVMIISGILLMVLKRKETKKR